MDLNINLDLEELISALPTDQKEIIRAVGAASCFVSENFTLRLSLKINPDCTLTGVWEKVPA